MTIACRPGTTADRSFIVSAWSSSYRLSRDCSFIQMATYADVMHPIVESVLNRPRTETIIAHGSEAMMGFVAFERPDMVMYVYVAQPYRRNGIARQLFAAACIDPDGRFKYAARTRVSWEIMTVSRKAQLAEYRPMEARYAEKEKQ